MDSVFSSGPQEGDVVALDAASPPNVAATAGKAVAAGPARDCYLDVLRASAIVMVLIYHVVAMSPVALPGVGAVTHFGAYGVDVFFVLSGWLIGGLYWREQRRFGDVRLGRFLPRRWIRTIPPYLVALLLSWLAVRIARHEAFDGRYLLFIQNYLPVIPFFEVSWSLCVEEHFYLFLPALLWVWTRLKIPAHWLFACLLITAPVCRAITARHGIGGGFGYTLTATHLRMEGLILGFWMAYFPSMSPGIWQRLKQAARWLLIPACLGLACLPLLSDRWMYMAGLTILAVALTTILVCLTGRAPNRFAASAGVKWVALTSYSVYLTHALVIHVGLMILDRMHSHSLAVYFPLTIALIAAVGATFYFVVEWTSLRLRDRVAPRRARA